MNEDIIVKLQEVFTPIAAKIGEGAEFGWEVIMKQQYVVAILGVVQFMFGVLLAIGTYSFVRYAIKRNKDNRGYYNDWTAVGIVVSTFGGVFAITSIMCGFYDAITHFINPEYYAIEFFINLVK